MKFYSVYFGDVNGCSVDLRMISFLLLSCQQKEVVLFFLDNANEEHA